MIPHAHIGSLSTTFQISYSLFVEALLSEITFCYYYDMLLFVSMCFVAINGFIHSFIHSFIQIQIYSENVLKISLLRIRATANATVCSISATTPTLFIYLIWNRTRSKIKAKKKKQRKNMQTKLRTYTNKGMQIVTRAERKLPYKQNMLLQHNQFQSSKCA